MRVLFVNRTPVPVVAYGGTERIVWDLALELARIGHRITFLTPEGSHCDFARVLTIDKSKPLLPQIPRDIDIVHFQFQPDFDLDQDFGPPYLMTEHGNTNVFPERPLNTVFVSRDHAQRHKSDQYVYNGLNWAAYGAVDLSRPRSGLHFLGMAERRAKNVAGAIQVALGAKVRLDVLGGRRFNFRRGIRLTFSPSVRFHGMVGDEKKSSILNGSQGLIFPIRWHEPFGLAVIESLYFGCPVFATPYGALPEIVPDEVGRLSPSRSELIEAVRSDRFERRACHEHARDNFNSERMARSYLEKYERVLSGEKLNATPPRSPLNLKARLPWSR